MIEYIHHDMAMALNQRGCPQSIVSRRWHLSTIAYEDHIHHHVDPRCVSVHHHLCSHCHSQTLIDRDYKLRSSMNSQKTNNNT